MSDYLDGIFDNSELIRDCSSQLFQIANAFSMTGNAQVAEELRIIASDIYEAQKGINDAVSMELNRRTTDAKKQAGETLKLVLNHSLSE